MDEGSGILTTTSSGFDRDLATSGTEYYDIVVSATDQGGRSATETIRLSVTGINDNPPEFSNSLYRVIIRETDEQGLFNTLLRKLIVPHFNRRIR